MKILGLLVMFALTCVAVSSANAGPEESQALLDELLKPYPPSQPVAE
jgi:hypothetical protein